RTDFDLLLLDNELHDCTGLQLLSHARRQPHHQHTPIILLSVRDCAGEALQAGADAFLRKPNNIVEILDTVRRLLDARPVPHAIADRPKN
ncbi:MAG: response regulator, partial [Acidobacteria bacterium]|nr:response regulator [Acidobacteriota bacterium]